MNSGSECQTKTNRQTEDRRERNVLNDCVVVFSCVCAAQCAQALQSHKPNTMSMEHTNLWTVSWWMRNGWSMTSHPQPPSSTWTACSPTNLKLSTACIWCSSDSVSFTFARYMDWCMQCDGVPAGQVRCWPQKRVVFECLILLELTSTRDKHFLRSTFYEWSRLIIKIKVKLKIYFFHCFRIKAWVCQTF